MFSDIKLVVVVGAAAVLLWVAPLLLSRFKMVFRTRKLRNDFSASVEARVGALASEANYEQAYEETASGAPDRGQADRLAEERGEQGLRAMPSSHPDHLRDLTREELTYYQRNAQPSDVLGGPPDGNAEFVTVYFATDRRRTNDLGTEFGGVRGEGDDLSYGRAAVSIPSRSRPGDYLRPRKFLKIFELPESERLHVVIQIRQGLRKPDFYESLSSELRSAPAKHAFVFIHGYNVEFDDALRRTAKLCYDLSFDGPAILYSWPSAGKLSAYIRDEATVQWSAPHFREFLADVLTRIDADSVHVVAHSMGNRLLADAVERMEASAPKVRRRARLSQVVFTAPDIDSSTFKDLATQFEAGLKADRFTLYASSRDRALAASAGIHGYARAGMSGVGLVVVPGIDTIDASASAPDFLSHSYYADDKSVIADMYYLLNGGVPPDQRVFLRRSEHPDGHYWRLNL